MCVLSGICVLSSIVYPQKSSVQCTSLVPLPTTKAPGNVESILRSTQPPPTLPHLGHTGHMGAHAAAACPAAVRRRPPECPPLQRRSGARRPPGRPDPGSCRSRAGWGWGRSRNRPLFGVNARAASAEWGMRFYAEKRKNIFERKKPFIKKSEPR